MAQRRMFSPQIVESEEFLTMPISSQALYFHLGMNADDDGFIQPSIVMRQVGSSNDDLKVLLTKRFLLAFEGGVVVVKHWLIHNLIQKDRYHPTRFQEEKKTLFIKENKAYTDSVNKMLPEVRLGKVSLLGDVGTSQGLPSDGPEDDTSVEAVDDNGDPFTTRQKKDTTYRKVFNLFGNYPKNWNMNRTEIAAAKNILEEHGMEKAVFALEFYRENKDEPHCPQILKPSDLDRKWVNLQAMNKKNG